MPVVPHDKQIEPAEAGEVWRFFKLEYFRDLEASEELYFRWTDTYKSVDPNEGLPTDGYLRRALGLVSNVYRCRRQSAEGGRSWPTVEDLDRDRFARDLGALGMTLDNLGLSGTSDTHGGRVSRG